MQICPSLFLQLQSTLKGFELLGLRDRSENEKKAFAMTSTSKKQMLLLLLFRVLAESKRILVGNNHAGSVLTCTNCVVLTCTNAVVSLSLSPSRDEWSGRDNIPKMKKTTPKGVSSTVEYGKYNLDAKTELTNCIQLHTAFLQERSLITRCRKKDAIPLDRAE